MSNQGHLPECKVVFVGDSSVGKTSIIQRVHNGQYSSDRPSTIGAAFISKTVRTEFGEASLQIWDTAGQERYRSLVPMYSRGAAIAIVVYDVSEPESFQGIEDWVNCVQDDMLEKGKVIIAGNKCDLDFAVPKSESDKWASDHGIDIIYLSAKTGENCDFLISTAAESLPEELFRTEDNMPQENKDKKKCC